MPSPESIVQTLESVGVDTVTLARAPGQTVLPRTMLASGQFEPLLMDLNESGIGSLDGKIDMRGTIGEGGMAIVRVGWQRATHRDVAVKSLKPDCRSFAATVDVLREGWVTGRLEHPNIIPVYDIARDFDGSPLIILKKIEGTDWSSLIHDEAAARERFGVEDLLGWNLGILIQVCNAVGFAHSRGIVHRDLKPENVMIGPFGEVYLVDWGIAVSMVDDGSGLIPLAVEARDMAGTPHYMAPEMLGGDAGTISERTDIYLLGAVLYEIIAGTPPHVGTSMLALVAAIMRSDPPKPADAPAELSEIARRAMASDPSERFESAESFRLAVQGFLRHRDAARLSERASERVEVLLALLNAHGEPRPEDRENAYRLFGECRFAFRHALEVWPTNELAHVSLAQACEAMVDYELHLGSPEAAAALIHAMESPPTRLVERVEQARLAKREHEASLRRISEDLDPARGWRTRSFVILIVGSLWVLQPLVMQALIGRYGAGSVPYARLSVSLVPPLAVAALMVWARESMMRSAINRRILGAALIAISAPLIARVVALRLGEPSLNTIHQMLLLWAAVTATLSLAISPKLLVGAFALLLAYVVVPFLGLHTVYYALSAANLVLLITLMQLWRQLRDDEERTAP